MVPLFDSRAFEAHGSFSATWPLAAVAVLPPFVFLPPSLGARLAGFLFMVISVHGSMH